jgi:hypothetical protein
MRVSWRALFLFVVAFGLVASGCGSSSESTESNSLPTIDRSALELPADDITDPAIEVPDEQVFVFEDLPPCADPLMDDAVICLDPPGGGSGTDPGGVDQVDPLEELCSNRSIVPAHWGQVMDGGALWRALRNEPIERLTIRVSDKSLELEAEYSLGGVSVTERQSYQSDGRGGFNMTNWELEVKLSDGSTIKHEAPPARGTHSEEDIRDSWANGVEKQGVDTTKSNTGQPPVGPDGVPVDPTTLEALCSGKAQKDWECRTDLQANCDSPVESNCKDPVTGEAVQADSAEPIEINCYGEVEEATCGTGEFVSGCFVVMGDCPPNVQPGVNPDGSPQGCPRAIDLNGDGVNDPGAISDSVPIQLCNVVTCNPGLLEELREQREALPGG